MIIAMASKFYVVGSRRGFLHGHCENFVEGSFIALGGRAKRAWQTNIACSRFVFIRLIMSNKRAEQYFIDNFRAGLTADTGSQNYKTSLK